MIGKLDNQPPKERLELLSFFFETEKLIENYGTQRQN
jgi:hypothetical protein